MSLLYYDNDIKKYEEELDFSNIVLYLEQKFNEEKEYKLLTTLIASAWYYSIEGGFLLKTNSFDDAFFISKWKQYTELALKDYKENAEVCLIAGYVLDLHWFYLDLEYQNLDQEFYKNCIIHSDNEIITALAKYWSEVPTKKKKHNKIENAEQICKQLFPSESELDIYFRSILTHKYK